MNELVNQQDYETMMGRQYEPNTDGAVRFEAKEEAVAPEESSFEDTMRAEQLVNNPMFQFYQELGTRPKAATKEELSENYEPEIPEGLNQDEQIDFLSYSITPRHAEQWSSDYQKRQQARRTIGNASLGTSLLAGGLVAGADPFMLPAYVAPPLLGGRLATMLGYETVIAAGTSGASEVALHAQQSERTKTESAVNIGLSVVMADAMIGAGHAITVGNSWKQVDELVNDINTRPVDMDVPSNKSASAAETMEDLPQRLEEALNKRFGDDGFEVRDGNMTVAEARVRLEAERTRLVPEMSMVKGGRIGRNTQRALGIFSPIMRLSTSESHAVRQMSRALVEAPTQELQHGFGASSGFSVETARDFMINQYSTVVKTASKSGFVDQKKVTGNTMSQTEFNTKLTEALWRNGDASNPVVDRVAKELRASVLEPIEKDLLRLGMIKKDYDGFENLKMEDFVHTSPVPGQGNVGTTSLGTSDAAKLFNDDGSFNTSRIGRLSDEDKQILAKNGLLKEKAARPKGDEGYLHRVWDFDKIRLNPTEFDTMLKDLFRADGVRRIEQNIADAKQRVSDIENDLKHAGEDGSTVTAGHSDFDAKKQAKVELRQADVVALEKSITRYQKQLQDKVNAISSNANGPWWKQVEDISIKIEGKQFDVVVARRALNDVLETKPSLKEQLKQAKFDRDTAIRGEEPNKRILESQLETAAEELRTTITSDGYNMSKGLQSFKAGPLKERSVDIPSEDLGDFLVKDIDEIMDRYMLHIAPQIAMADKFGLKGSNVADQVTELVNVALKDHDRLIAATPAGAKRKRAVSRKVKDTRDITAMFEQLLNRYKTPDGGDSIWTKASENLRAFQFLTKLGGMLLPAIPDMFHTTMRHGMGNTLKHLGHNMFQTEGVKASNRFLKSFAIHSDIWLNERARKLEIGDTIQGLTKGNRFENARDQTVDAFSKATGMPHWNAGWKTLVGGMYSDEVAGLAIKAASGKMSARDLTRFAQAGLSETDLKIIAKEVGQHGEMKSGIHLPNPDDWTDKAVAQRFKMAIYAETRKTIVTPGIGDLPLFSRTQLGKVVLQFKSFTMAATNRVLLANLDDFTTGKLISSFMMIGAGYAVHAAKKTIKGEEADLENETMRERVHQGLSRSGLGGVWLGEVEPFIGKLTGGKLSLSGTTVSKYASRNMFSTLAGVSAGTVQDAAELAYAASSGEFAEANENALRRVTVAQNLLPFVIFERALKNKYGEDIMRITQ